MSLSFSANSSFPNRACSKLMEVLWAVHFNLHSEASTSRPWGQYLTFTLRCLSVHGIFLLPVEAVTSYLRSDGLIRAFSSPVLEEISGDAISLQRERERETHSLRPLSKNRAYLLPSENLLGFSENIRPEYVIVVLGTQMNLLFFVYTLRSRTKTCFLIFSLVSCSCLIHHMHLFFPEVHL